LLERLSAGVLGGRRRPAGRGVALRRLLLSLAIGCAVLLATLVAGAVWSIGVALGWDAAALAFLLLVWPVVYRLDPAETARVARVEDASVAAADVVLLCASIASLASIAFVLVDASPKTGGTKALYIALAVSSVALAWATVHTIFMLRYARLYYSDPVGGIDFHADEPPDYLDLAYIALTIGMTFQVSDTDLTARPIRRAAVRHALLSYVFGAVIVAITINIVGTLASA
jgi:uncharacterized membrane protein